MEKCLGRDFFWREVQENQEEGTSAKHDAATSDSKVEADGGGADAKHDSGSL